MAGLDLSIYGNVPFSYWAIPDIVISFSMAYKRTAMNKEHVPNLTFKALRH